MDPRTQERVERWDSRPFSGGYDGLTSLAADEFSGAVTADGTWLFVLNGRIVGVEDGEIEDFSDASGTIYDAPAPSLPLLCAMEERGGETRAKYYTNETPLSEVDETLQDGSFTGYVELSKSILSGDYYLVYYGGRRMAAAYIGNAGRLLTGDEAFERADDEVGIYEVIDVDVEVTDVPGTDESDQESVSATDATPSGQSADVESSTQAADEPTSESTDAVDGSESPGESAGTAATDDRAASPSDAGTTDESTETGTGTEAGAGTEAGTGADTGTEPDAGADAESAESSRATTAHSETTPADGEESDEEQAAGADDSSASPVADEVAAADDITWGGDRDERSSTSESEQSSETTVTESSSESDDDSELEEQLRQEEEWRETRSIPSLDPDHSEPGSKRGSGGRRRPASARSNAGAADRSPADSERGETDGEATTERSNSSNQNATERSGRSSDSSPKPDQGPSTVGSDETLEPDMLEREDRIDQLTQRVDELEAKREELEAERDRLASENQERSATIDRLQSRIDELESELERARSVDATAATRDAASGAESSGQTLSAQRALSETNLFVRYQSKSQPTLRSAHAGEADAAEVASNLQLEHHTQFDDTGATVDGRPYEEFLRDSIEYQFVDWLTGTLLYEIRDTGHADALADLYDAIPRIDRAELHASISLEDDEYEEVPDEVGFDVVAFDKMGTPLIVANLNDSRDPATREMLESLEEASSSVGANYSDLGAAFVVTSSFFEPGALEVADEATSGGLLSRSSKLSYVNLSRKQGYHLCLVESRTGGFHMNVPEL